MAEPTVVAHLYATALIDAAADANAVEPVGADMKVLAAWLHSDAPALASALSSPVVSLSERTAVLAALLERLSVHPLVANLLKVANDKGRFDLIEAIAAAYADLADERAGRMRVHVQVAEALSDELHGEIRNALAASTGKDVQLDVDIRPELIGGLIARIGDRVYDTSVRTQLRQIKKTLLNSQLPGQA